MRLIGAGEGQTISIFKECLENFCNKETSSLLLEFYGQARGVRDITRLRVNGIGIVDCIKCLPESWTESLVDGTDGNIYYFGSLYH